ncbi:glycosyl transferase [Bifidobacterium apri]|uniref:Glycosyl transferase n=2 Tax=Bifidobacterium apri TaxID=1769423 RepID=A0A6A2V7F8_9BIFI|nr:glycosyl transferase [Bifidobacterium apri]
MMSNADLRDNADGDVRDQSDPLHGRKLRVGIISPYSFETPGGVQLHIRDFAKELIARGHEVEVLAPGRRTNDMPLWVQTVGTSFAIPYNGSVSRLSYFGFVGAQVRRWVRQGHFDIVHLHEPEAPSLSHKPLTMVHHPPLVGTFHAAFNDYPFALRFFHGYLHRYLRPLARAICVSDASRAVAERYLPQNVPVSVIPNGISTRQFACAVPVSSWQGDENSPTIGFLGRMGEERKGFAVFCRAASRILDQYPQARFLCAGDGEREGQAMVNTVDPSGRLMDHMEFLGRISDEDKARFYRSLSVYVAPQTGGESFGIVLAEAMAAGCPVVASNLPAFVAVADEGRAAALFDNGDESDCAAVVCSLIADREARESLGQAGRNRARQYDWSSVVDRVLGVYAEVLS